MAVTRKLRMEEEGGIFHVINRGNYRSWIFRSEKTKAAFLKCLDQTCEKTGWRVHAWCLMSNHYHLAVETPRPNLADGMRWLQGAFALRFNRLRKQRGHLFQGRYKSLIVEPGAGLGSLCHYIHLNAVRAKLCSAKDLAMWPWSSMNWLIHPKKRPAWHDPFAALEHAGGLKDTGAGRRKYIEYLAWLAENEPARKEMQFETMSAGWAIGSVAFKKELAQEHAVAAAHVPEVQADLAKAREATWEEFLDRMLKRLGKSRADLANEGKSVEWKLAISAALKTHATVTNRWLAETLHMGNMHEVSRKVSAWSRRPATSLSKKLQ
ncbi:MAG: transposase [Opitutaceae bacterium]